MSDNHTVHGARVRRGIARLMAGSAVAALALAAYALPVWIDKGEAYAQGGIGAGNGSAAATILGEQNALGVPGGTASVSFSVATLEGDAAAVGFDVVYDSTFVDLTTAACQLSSRLEDQIRSVTFPPADQPDPPNRRLRIGVFPPITDPIPSFDDGELVVCDFSVAANAVINDVIELAVEPLQVARADSTAICEGDDCDAVNGSILIGQVVPPTATRTPSVVPPTATRTPTATSTIVSNTSTPTSTPTTVVAETETPTVTPTATTVPPTNTPRPTATATVPPTSTSPPATATSSPAPTAAAAEFDDSCAIVPVEQSSPYRSLILLLGPALLLWGRRRGH